MSNEEQSMPINPYNQEKGLLSFQVDNEEIIQDISHSISEELPIATDEGRIIWKNMSGKPPMINKRGVYSMVAKLRSRMTKVFALSNIEEDIIENFSCSFANEVIDDLYQNWEQYEVREPAAASAIVNMMVENYYAVLRKSKKGTYLNFLKTSQIVQEATSYREESNQKNDTPSFEEARGSLPIFGNVMSKARGRRR